jgi:phosphoesterase RecJ-like protein
MLELTSLKEFLAVPRHIVITTHPKPDGDAMGSSLGLYAYLKLKGHQVSVITPTDYPTFLAWLPNNSHVIIYTEKTEQSQQLIASADLIFCLDFNSLVRINEMGTYVRDSTAKKVMIEIKYKFSRGVKKLAIAPPNKVAAKAPMLHKA